MCACGRGHSKGDRLHAVKHHLFIPSVVEFSGTTQSGGLSKVLWVSKERSLVKNSGRRMPPLLRLGMNRSFADHLSLEGQPRISQVSVT